MGFGGQGGGHPGSSWAAAGLAGVPRTPSHRGPPVCLAPTSGLAGGGVRLPSPASPPAAGLLTSAVSLPPSAGAVAGPGDMGAGWRAESSPYESLRHRPGPSTSIPGLSSAPCKRAKSQGRLLSAPLHTCSPGRSRPPGHSPGRASPPGPALMARRPPGPCPRRGPEASGRAARPGMLPAVSSAPAALNRLGATSPGLYNSPSGAGPAAPSPAVPRLHAGPSSPMGSALTLEPPRGVNCFPAARQPGPRGPPAGRAGRCVRAGGGAGRLVVSSRRIIQHGDDNSHVPPAASPGRECADTGDAG